MTKRLDFDKDSNISVANNLINMLSIFSNKKSSTNINDKRIDDDIVEAKVDDTNSLSSSDDREFGIFYMILTILVSTFFYILRSPQHISMLKDYYKRFDEYKIIYKDYISNTVTFILSQTLSYIDDRLGSNHTPILPKIDNIIINTPYYNPAFDDIEVD
jgi:hypothetical protein